MRSYWRQYLGAALLPLLILAGLAGPGGWFCANGSPCAPVFAATCCCGRTEGARPADNCCAAATGARRISLAARSCGCYFAAESVPSHLTPAPALGSAPAFPPAAPAVTRPPVRLVATVCPALSVHPPGFRLSPGPTRAPPAA